MKECTFAPKIDKTKKVKTTGAVGARQPARTAQISVGPSMTTATERLYGMRKD